MLRQEYRHHTMVLLSFGDVSRRSILAQQTSNELYNKGITGKEIKTGHAMQATAEIAVKLNNRRTRKPCALENSKRTQILHTLSHPFQAKIFYQSAVLR